jgi:hypothetical protein
MYQDGIHYIHAFVIINVGMESEPGLPGALPHPVQAPALRLYSSNGRFLHRVRTRDLIGALICTPCSVLRHPSRYVHAHQATPGLWHGFVVTGGVRGTVVFRRDYDLAVVQSIACNGHSPLQAPAVFSRLADGRQEVHKISRAFFPPTNESFGKVPHCRVVGCNRCGVGSSHVCSVCGDTDSTHRSC